MRNILITISYDGTHFCGWQKQNGERTVQEEIEKALLLVHKTETPLSGSGRTDSGVHAMAQAATFLSPVDSIPVERYPLALNTFLPHDVRIMGAREVPSEFHARFSATSRTYRYFLHCAALPPAHELPFVWAIHRYPDCARLNRMASCLHGELDCSVFASSGDKSPSKCRYIEKAVFYMQGEKLVFEITANAFLWKMVRSIVGSLLHYENRGMDKADFARIVESKDRSRAGPTAPATGLFLWNVGFDGVRRGPAR